MQAETIIKASATVTRITELHPGDVYKRLDNQGYADPQLVFGIVTDIMSNGEDAAVVVTEISKSYVGGPTVKELKVFGTGSAIAIFPATPVEIAARFADYRAEMARKVHEANQALFKAQAEAALVDRTLNAVEERHIELRTPQHAVHAAGWKPEDEAVLDAEVVEDSAEQEPSPPAF